MLVLCHVNEWKLSLSIRPFSLIAELYMGCIRNNWNDSKTQKQNMNASPRQLGDNFFKKKKISRINSSLYSLLSSYQTTIFSLPAPRHKPGEFLLIFAISRHMKSVGPWAWRWRSRRWRYGWTVLVRADYWVKREVLAGGISDPSKTFVRSPQAELGFYPKTARSARSCQTRGRGARGAPVRDDQIT